MAKQIDINEHSTPPGGWSYRVAQTGWSVPNPISVTLDQATKLVVKHLAKNPAIVAKHKLADDYDTVRRQILDYTRKRLGIKVVEAAPANFPVPHSRASAVAAVGGKIARLAAGFGTLYDWLMSGGEPVGAELAAGRAAVCAECSHNAEGAFGTWFTAPASAQLKRAIEHRKELSLTTPLDERINVCDVCFCPLKLKVHTPLEHVLKHLKPEVRAELPAHCWMVKENAP